MSKTKSRKMKVKEEVPINDESDGDEGAAAEEAKPSVKGNKRPSFVKEEKRKERKAAKKHKKVKFFYFN